MPRRGSWGGTDFPQAKAIRVDDGIKANSKRGDFGEHWWAKRWLQVLESLNLGTRLASGRTYARKGQVLSIDVRAGAIDAEVQGSQKEPYAIHIALKPFTKSEREGLAEALAASPLHAAQLAAGTMPEDIENLLERRKLALFPMRRTDLDTDCSCPDWSNPCKHIAAVYYLVGEEFDRDPYLIFAFRGVMREELIGMAAAGDVAAAPQALSDVAPTAPTQQAEQPLVAGAAVPHDFWDAPRATIELFPESDDADAGALLVRLGPFPFWRGEVPISEVLAPLYRGAGATLRDRHEAD